MAKFIKLSFCQKLIFWHQPSSCKCSMCLHCVGKVSDQIVSAKAVVQVDWPAYALSMHKQTPLRITKGNNSKRIGPLPLFFYYKYSFCGQFVDINVFAKFDEIPSLPVQGIKEKPQCCGKQEKHGLVHKAVILSKINFLTSNFFMQMFNVSTLCRQSIRLFQQKPWYKLIGPHMHYLCINNIH